MKNLKLLRNENGLSQEKLAHELNTTQQNIYKYERGLTEPDLQTLISIANFFNTSVDYLIGYTDIPRKYETLSIEHVNEQERNHLLQYRKLTTQSQQLIDLLIKDYTKK